MTIPAYPTFRPIALEDKPEINDALSLNPPEISELTFTNLFAWRNAYQPELARLKDYLLISSFRDGHRFFFDPIGKGDRKDVMGNLLKDTDAHFFRLPERTQSLFANDPLFNIELDRDNSDYLYNAEDLIHLRGGAYDGKRNLIRNFRSSQPNYEYIKLIEENLAACWEFVNGWCEAHECEAVLSLNAEWHAIREMLNQFTYFGLVGGAIRVDGIIRALTLAERLNTDTLVVHVLKAEANLIGLYQIMMRDFLAREAKGTAYVNLEQDLGVEGLRKAKLSYHPLRWVNKYDLELKSKASSKWRGQGSGGGEDPGIK